MNKGNKKIKRGEKTISSLSQIIEHLPNIKRIERSCCCCTLLNCLYSLTLDTHFWVYLDARFSFFCAFSFIRATITHQHDFSFLLHIPFSACRVHRRLYRAMGHAIHVDGTLWCCSYQWKCLF